MRNKALIRISFFYLLAISLSNIFRFDLIGLNDIVESMPIWTMVLFSPLGASGILIGALISIYLLRKERKTEFSIFGTSQKWSLAMVLVPILMMSVIGVKNSNGVNVHCYGFIAGIGTLIYCFCEEIGWRGYLQDELIRIKE